MTSGLAMFCGKKGCWTSITMPFFSYSCLEKKLTPVLDIFGKCQETFGPALYSVEGGGSDQTGCFGSSLAVVLDSPWLILENFWPFERNWGECTGLRGWVGRTIGCWEEWSNLCERLLLESDLPVAAHPPPRPVTHRPSITVARDPR